MLLPDERDSGCEVRPGDIFWSFEDGALVDVERFMKLHIVGDML